VANGTEHSIDLRELRHDTGAARIVPVVQPATSPIVDRLRSEGRLRPAARPGYRPAMRPGGGTNRLTDVLAALRDEESGLPVMKPGAD
jgi:hypothetical protein